MGQKLGAQCWPLAFIFAAVLMAGANQASAADPIRPDPHLTPGAVLTTDTSRICTPGYAKSVRHTSGELKHLIYREYGIDPRGGHYEIDHLVSLELGGADVRANLWPESYDTEPWNAHLKDRLENFLHRAVCERRIPVGEAQREIATDWIAAYEKYLGEPISGRRSENGVQFPLLLVFTPGQLRSSCPSCY